MLKQLALEYENYYRNLRDEFALNHGSLPLWDRINADWRQYYDANPDASSALQKARLYQLIAEKFEPFITPASPFFFESRMRFPENWGTPSPNQPGGTAYYALSAKKGGSSRERDLAKYSQGNPDRDTALWINGGVFDTDHHSPGYTGLVTTGFRSIREEISALPEQNDETAAMLAGIDCMARAAARFADRAEQLMAETGPTENLRLIAETGRRIPLEAPRTFYEGLQMILFVREMMASFDNIGLSVLGRPDKILYGLYCADLAAGRLTREKAARLIAMWMLPHDIKTFTREREWPETSTCLMLGGCDENGNFIYNDLTKLFLEVHYANSFINPKLNCRCSAAAPQEYLEQICSYMLKGHNHFACLNDDVLVPAQIRYGKTLADARNYVNGGCQETMCEGVEHSAGAFFYFSLAQTFRQLFNREADPPELFSVLPDENPDSFVNFYQQMIDGYRHTIDAGCRWICENNDFSQLHPSPLFSSTIAGCIANAKDYTAGGARYNLSGITLVGLGDIVNCLYAIKRGVYDEKFTTLAELRRATAANWPAEYEVLRQRILALPRYGGNHSEVDELAARFVADITAVARACPNERGEYFQPSFFVYFRFFGIGQKTKATPDGRRDGDILSQGIAPHRINAPESVTTVIASLSGIDFKNAPGNAVLDLQMPLSQGLNPANFAAMLRSAFKAGIPTIQPNLINIDDLKAAQAEPEKYPNLVVRISGLSAVFVKLNKTVQDEIISRRIFNT